MRGASLKPVCGCVRGDHLQCGGAYSVCDSVFIAVKPMRCLNARAAPQNTSPTSFDVALDDAIDMSLLYILHISRACATYARTLFACVWSADGHCEQIKIPKRKPFHNRVAYEYEYENACNKFAAKITEVAMSARPAKGNEHRRTNSNHLNNDGYLEMRLCKTLAM